MGRFAEKTTREQRDACAVEVLDRGRTRASVARDGIPGIMPAGYISEKAVGDYVRAENNRRRPPIARAGVREAGENIHRRALELADRELRKIEDQRTTIDLDRIARLQDIASKAIRSVPQGKPTTDKPNTRAKDKPNTLANRLANGQAERDVGSEAVKPTDHETETHESEEFASNGSNGGGGVQSKARAVELLNHPVTNASL